MDEATLALTIMTGLLLASFLGFFIWGIRSGQFKNIEEAKYRIFRNNRTNDIRKEDSETKTQGGGGEQ